MTLLVDPHQHLTSLITQALADTAGQVIHKRIIANPLHRLADDRVVIQLSTGGDFTEYHYHVVLACSLTCYFALRVLLQAGVQHCIRDLVRKLVGMSLIHGLRREQEGAPLEVWLSRADTPRLLDDHARRVCTGFMALVDWETLAQAGKEAAHIRITSTIGVHNLLLCNRHNWIDRAGPPVCHDRRIRALRDHHITVLVLRTWDQRQSCCNECNVLCVPSLSLSPGPGLGLISKQEIHVGKCLDKASLERGHLHEERRREIHAIEAALLCRHHRSKLNRLR